MRLGQLLDLGAQRARVDQIVRAPGWGRGRRSLSVFDGEGSHAHPIAEVGR
jgi:hypothetical protein